MDCGGGQQQNSERTACLAITCPYDRLIDIVASNNATIRGTLKTAVFEKETVNAVGGQLYVANSTVLTSSCLLYTSPSPRDS